MPRKQSDGSRSPSYIPSEARFVGPDNELARREFGDRIRVRMNQKGWTQAELARKADLARDAVSTYIRGVTWPTAPALKKLAKALGCPVEELIPAAGPAKIEAPVELRQEGDVMHLRVNKRVSLDQAARILAILDEKPAGTGLPS